MLLDVNELRDVIPTARIGTIPGGNSAAQGPLTPKTVPLSALPPSVSATAKYTLPTGPALNPAMAAGKTGASHKLVAELFEAEE